MSWTSGARRSAFGALIVGMLLVGCTTDSEQSSPDPTPAPTPAQTTPVDATPSPEPTTDPGPTPWPEPTRPAAMDRDDLDGAIAAAEYFLALYPYVYATGDLDTWEEMSHPECQFCESTVENVTRIYDDGGYALGSEFAVEDVGASPPDDEYEHYRIGIYGTEEPGEVYTADGELISRTEGGPGVYHFGILQAEQSWQVRGVFGESGDE